MPQPVMAMPGYPGQSLNAAAAPSNGSVVVLPNYAGSGQPRKFSWDVVLTGAAASLQVDLQGSDTSDFTNFVQVDTYNVNASTVRNVVDKTFKFYRVALVAIGAGGGSISSSIYI